VQAGIAVVEGTQAIVDAVPVVAALGSGADGGVEQDRSLKAFDFIMAEARRMEVGQGGERIDVHFQTLLTYVRTVRLGSAIDTFIRILQQKTGGMTAGHWHIVAGLEAAVGSISWRVRACDWADAGLGSGADSGDEAAAGSDDEAAAGSDDEAAAGSDDEAAADSGDEAAAGSDDEAAAGSDDEAAAGSDDEVAEVASVVCVSDDDEAILVEASEDETITVVIPDSDSE